MMKRKIAILVFILMAFLMNDVSAVVSYHKDVSKETINVDDSKIETTVSTKKIGFWKTLKEFRKLKKTLKNNPSDGKLLVGWGLLLIAVPLVLMLIYRSLLSWWFLPILTFAGIVMLIIGIIRYIRKRKRG